MKKTGLLFTLIFTILNTFSQQIISLNDALSHKGDSVTITGKVFGGAYLQNVKTKPTFLNVGDSTNPLHRLMIRIEPEDRIKFQSPPESLYVNKSVTVTGVLTEYKGSALIRISEPDRITLDDQPVAYNGEETVKPSHSKTEKVPPALQQKAKPSISDPPSRRDTLFQVTPVTRSKSTTAKHKNVRKELVLRASPQNSAPVVAILDPGTVLVVPYLTRKWTYVFVKSDNGVSKIFGFIKTKAVRRLKGEH